MLAIKTIILVSMTTCVAEEVAAKVAVNPSAVVVDLKGSSMRTEPMTEVTFDRKEALFAREEPDEPSSVSAVLSEKGVVGSSDDGTAMNFVAVLVECGRLLGKDPVVMSLSLLSCAYVIARILIGAKDEQQPAKSIRKNSSWKAHSDRTQTGSWRSDATPINKPTKPVRQARGKSQVAIQVNQQLMRLETSSEVLDCALAYSGQTDIVNVVTAIHRSSKLTKSRKDFASDPRLVKLLDQLHGFMQQEQPITILTRAVGNTSWALAKVQFSCGDDAATHPILDTLQVSFVKHATSFKPEEMMNTVWAFAELRRESKEGQQRALEIAKAAVDYFDRFPEFTLQQVVYFAWALGRLSGISCVRSHAEVRHGLALYAEKICERVRAGKHTLTSKNLAMTAWGMAHLESKLSVSSNADVKGLLLDIAEESVRRGLATFSAGDLSSIVWALSKTHAEHRGFYGHLRDTLLLTGLGAYNAQDAANVISICVIRAAQEKDEVFLKLLAQTAEANANAFTKLEKIMVHWAFSQVTYPMPELNLGVSPPPGLGPLPTEDS